MAHTHIHSPLKYRQLAALRALATYRFLSMQQMIRLGISRSKQGIRTALSEMRPKETEHPYINVIDLGLHPGKGRLPFLFFLTKEGAEKLAEVEMVSPSEIFHYKSVEFFVNDYFHRVLTVDFHIEMSLFCEQHDYLLTRFETYFGHSGNNRKGDGKQLTKNTKIEFDDGSFLIPDIIAEVQDISGRTSPFAIEIYNSFSKRRIEKQLHKHLLVLATGALSKKLNLSCQPLILSVFAEQKDLLAMYNRLKDDEAFARVRSYFGFSTIADLQKDFVNRWLFLDGQTRAIIAKQPKVEDASLFVSDLISRHNSSQMPSLESQKDDMPQNGSRMP